MTTVKTEMDDVIDKLNKLNACEGALEWLETQDSWEKAWRDCERGDWSIWLVGRLSGPPESKSRKKLVYVACQCARLALPYVPKGEGRPLKAIETAEAYVKGDATLDDVRTDAAAAADAAYAAAADAAAAAAAAADAAYAADAAAAAAYAAYAKRKEILKQCADIVRQHYPKPPELP